MEEIYKALNEFFEREYGEDEGILEDDLGAISLCTTTSEDGEYELQVILNLKDMCYEYYVDGEIEKTEYIDKKTLIQDLNNASFDEMIYEVSLLAENKEKEYTL